MAEVTIYADGDRNLEVIRISNDPKAPAERRVCQCAPASGALPESFDIRRGDLLIVRVED